MRMMSYSLLAVFFALACSTYAQPPFQNDTEAEPAAIPLFFRETFKGPAVPSPNEVVTPDHAANPDLELKLYGPGTVPNPAYESGLFRINRGDGLPGSEVTSWVWSGMTDANWGVMLRHKTDYVDLTGPARIRWRIRPRSFTALRLLIRLADGTMLAADYAEPNSTYFRLSETYIMDIPRWRVIDPERMVEGADTAWKTNVDLSKVDEVGFTDLSRGVGHNPAGSSAVDWIEVYGNPVKRTGS